MRLAKVEVYVRTAVLAALALAACSCQTAQKPVSLLPPGKAPALRQVTPPAQAPPTATTPAPSQANEAQPQKAARVEPTPASEAEAVPASDQVADLVARAEKLYQAGLSNHKAGKDDVAKENFDNALNALLSSNLDIRSDERLQEEFDRIVQGVNELFPGGTNTATEADTQQKSEPAPIDETNGLTPAPDAKVKAKAQAEVKNP